MSAPPVPPRAKRRAPDADPTGLRLTGREQQVLLRISRGLTNREIGHELCLSEDTVKTHARRLFRKLGARDRAHAVARGFQTGLLGTIAPPPPPDKQPEPRPIDPTRVGQPHAKWCSAWQPSPCNCRERR